MKQKDFLVYGQEVKSDAIARYIRRRSRLGRGRSKAKDAMYIDLTVDDCPQHTQETIVVRYQLLDGPQYPKLIASIARWRACLR
jgi:hypothetical protein